MWASMAWLLSSPRKPVEKSKCLLLSLDEAHSPAAGSLVLLCLSMTKGIFKDSRLPMSLCDFQNKAQSPQPGPRHPLYTKN